MTATAAMIARLRRMVAEPTGETYDDAEIAATLERFPTLDDAGNEPFVESLNSGSSEPNPDWVPSYDFHAAAADLWQEKASRYVEEFDFTADGSSFHVSQKYNQMLSQARFHSARRTPKSARPRAWPEEQDTSAWIGNLPESD